MRGASVTWSQLTFIAVGPNTPLHDHGHVYLRAFAHAQEEALLSFLIHIQLLGEMQPPLGRSFWYILFRTLYFSFTALMVVFFILVV